MLQKNIELRGKCILVTGAAGFIGSNLVQALLNQVEQINIIGIDNMNDYYDVYVTQPEDAKWRLDNMHETYLKDMNSKYVYPNVFMSMDDTNKVSQYDTDIKKYAEQKKADWILNGGIEEQWDSYLDKMEKYGLSDYLAIKQKYFDQYQQSLTQEK